jgi:nitroreductase
MNVFDAVDSRIACRHFLDKPVDLDIVKDILAKAARAASGGNLQSWNVYALTGQPLADLKAIVQQRIAREDPRHAKSEYPIYPDPMFGAYKERREAHGVQLYGSLGIAQADAAARLGQYKKNFEFFGAPVALFITIDRRLGPGQWADLGGYINSVAVLARGHGLDTCPQEAWARLYDTVCDFLKVPDNEMLFCGMAIGYGDRKHKANDFRSPRAELAAFCKFYGFD